MVFFLLLEKSSLPLILLFRFVLLHLFLEIACVFLLSGFLIVEDLHWVCLQKVPLVIICLLWGWFLERCLWVHHARSIIVAELGLRVILLVAFLLRRSSKVLLTCWIKVTIFVTLLKRVDVWLKVLRRFAARLAQLFKMLLLPFWVGPLSACFKALSYIIFILALKGDPSVFVLWLPE